MYLLVVLYPKEWISRIKTITDPWKKTTTDTRLSQPKKWRGMNKGMNKTCYFRKPTLMVQAWNVVMVRFIHWKSTMSNIPQWFLTLNFLPSLQSEQELQELQELQYEGKGEGEGGNVKGRERGRGRGKGNFRFASQNIRTVLNITNSPEWEMIV